MAGKRRVRQSSVIWRFARPFLRYARKHCRDNGTALHRSVQRFAMLFCYRAFRRREIETLLSTPLFDPAYYLEDNKDIEPRGADPAWHFIVRGVKEGRQPNPMFDLNFYLRAHTDVAESGEHPFFHYLTCGAAERRAPHRLFDPEYYLETNPSVAELGTDPLLHYMRFGVTEGVWPCDLSDVDLDDLVVKLHRTDIHNPDHWAFDPQIYRLLYADVRDLSEDDLHRHYFERGQRKRRIASRAGFVRSICADPVSIPLDFDPAEYLALNPDLEILKGQGKLSLLRHYMRHGRFERRIFTTRQIGGGLRTQWTSLPSDVGATPTDVGVRLAVLVHVYYPDGWAELAYYVRNLTDLHFDLYVNLVDTTWSEALHGQIRNDFPESHIIVSENRGRDIGGFFMLLSTLDVDAYDVFCLLHTKRSPHISEILSRQWRNDLLGSILGSPEIAQENVAVFSVDETAGSIASHRWRNTEVHRNEASYQSILERLNISDDARACEYVSGTMMFIRAPVLGRLITSVGYDEFNVGDRRSLDEDIDGQLEHVVERAIGNLTRDMGYRMLWR